MADHLVGKFRVKVGDEYQLVHPETEVSQIIDFKDSLNKRYIKRPAAQFNPNTVLEENVMAIETDTGKIKLGDGRTRFEDLEYVGGERNAQYTLTNTHDNRAASTNISPIGIMAVETDQIGIKVGDGVHRWLDLPYVIRENLYSGVVLDAEEG